MPEFLIGLNAGLFLRCHFLSLLHVFLVVFPQFVWLDISALVGKADEGSAATPQDNRTPWT
jgi:hypothetical protein